MLWIELFEILGKKIHKIKNDKVRIYDESTGDFIDADLIEMEDDDVIDKENLFIWKQST